MVNAGTLVNIASPMHTPDNKTNPVPRLESLECSAAKIDSKRNGNKIESSKILRNIQVMGITENNVAETNAILLP